MIARARSIAASALAFAGALASPQPAGAVPREIILLRHGEKQNAFALCPTGVQRSLALRAQYLGKGAAQSLFANGDTPAAFFVITLHTLELASPAAQSWGAPLIDYSVVPLKDGSQDDATVDDQLDERTREAANDVLTNPAWNGKTVVMIWEHKHIANAKIAKRAPQPSTLRELLHLDALGKHAVPATWSGTNYDYFWIVRYGAGTTPTSLTAVKQVFAPPFAALPHNDWDTPDDLPADSRCE